MSTKHRGYELFGENITYGTLAQLLRNGAEIKTTQLSEEFNFDSYLEKYGERSIPLFAIDNKQRLHIFVANGKMQPEKDWKIVSMVEPGPPVEEKTGQQDSGAVHAAAHSG